MNQQLAISNHHQNGAMPAQIDHLAGLPAWLRYLISAFPQTKLSSTTYAVMEDALSDFSADILMQSVRNYVKENEWFPKVSQIKAIAENLKPIEQIAIPSYMHYRHNLKPYWTECPVCEEFVPDISDCPACADLATMLAIA